jgi:hypothetical protein
MAKLGMWMTTRFFVIVADTLGLLPLRNVNVQTCFVLPVVLDQQKWYSMAK